ncbi:tetratricopeptide repeat protein [Novosphingobium sp. YJ-S2-02]|uniref:Ancillary SecYEG translocon subunit n=1 Tax=Novosphingobium aureum TaxID=2792964 RepID=A0A931MK32_9SPHN|nr:tetratricopeptide repeat protein [Novosphingobium aureum]
MALPPENSPASNDDRKAAQRAAQQDVFMREVDDAVRQDQMEGFMKTWGKPLLAVVVLGLAAFGGWLYWNHHQKSLREEHAEAFIQGLDSVKAGNLDDAKSKFEALAAKDAKANAAPAQLMLAGIAMEKDDATGAVKIYDQVAADQSVPKPLRDLATVRSVAARFDEMKPQDVVDRLKPMAAPGNAWFGVAGEMVAMAYLKMDKRDQAGPLFAAIAKDESVSDDLRSRARQLAAVLGVDAIDDVVDENGEALPAASAKK